ncbi:tyrosine-type recombinase/integrase [Geodermatophilus sp. CPCC 205761]|uniref:tyrosine-type recombinase/integrase n=1 Tax=Geodermatophilus sp. CPCC 205761 TaxID=2936597 RepID=UPI003EEDC814
MVRYSAERAVHSSGDVSWVVIDEDWGLHEDGVHYLTALSAAGHSINTQRAYAGRIARFLSWCADEHVDYRTISLKDLIRYKRALQATARPGSKRHEPQLIVGKTVDQHLIALCGFLRHCARSGRIPEATANQLSEPRSLHLLPQGMPLGESSSPPIVRARLLRANTVERPIHVLDDADVDAIVGVIHNVRDRFLFHLLLETGLRIGEALGLRREDMHLLPDSRSLGCAVTGAHVHVRRRRNPNGALAKSRKARHVPVTADLVGLYAVYQAERDRVAEAEANDMVLVNLYREPRGAAVSYSNVRDLFQSLQKRSGVRVHPHALRHTAATNWLRNGVDRDVVQRILGHMSPHSMSMYRDVSSTEMRAAVEKAARTRS